MKLRFGIIVDRPDLPRWAVECLARLCRSQIASLALVIVLPPPPRRIRRTSHGRFFDAYQRWVKMRSRSLQLEGISPFLAQAEIFSGASVVGPEGEVTLAAQDVSRIQRSRLDFIVHFGDRILRGAVCDAARHGVWTHSHAEDQRRGLVPGFWEVARGEPVSSAALQRLSSNGLAADLLRGFIGTGKSYPRNADALRTAGIEWCVQICRRIHLGQAPDAGVAATLAAAPAEVPRTRSLIRYFIRRFGIVCREIWRKLFFLEMWNIGFVAAPLGQILLTGRAEPVSWLRSPRRLRFLADPFAIEFQGKLHLLAEEFGYLNGKGWISQVSVQENFCASVRPLFTAPWHMSYPFLIRSEGKIFCVPETAEANRVLLFEARSFPDIWKEPITIIEGFAALDSTIFVHEGRWWLFCTNAAAAPEGELHGFYSQTLTGPWHPHPHNPLSCDIRSARPAGRPIVLDGILLRPGQDCSRGYGSAVTLMRIDRLTPTEFRETAMQVVVPNPTGRYPHGLHTVASLGNVTVIDGKRRMFSPIAFPLKLLSRFQKSRRFIDGGRSTAPDALPRKATPLRPFAR